MNDSLDLRNRILKMRESNNLTVSKENSLNANLMSKFESSIKDDNQKKSNSDQDIIISKNRETISETINNNPEDFVNRRNKSENKTFKTTVNDNEAQFLMLANKFNEAVEVILELSHKVEKLERDAGKNSLKQTNNVNNSSFINLKIIFIIILIPAIILGFFTLPFDFLLIKSIVIDILSTI